MIKEFLKLRNYTPIQWKHFYAGMVFMVLSALFSGISIFSTVPIIDGIIAGRDIILPETLPNAARGFLAPLVSALNALQPGALLKYLIVFIVTTIFLKGMFSYLHNYQFHFFGNRLLTDIRGKLYSKVNSLSMDFFTQGHSGEITSRIIFDVNMLMRAFVSHFPAFILQTTLVLVYLLMIFSIDWKLSLLSMLIFPPLLWPIYASGKKLKKLGRRQQEGYARVGNLIHEGVYGQQIIKAYNQQENIVKRFNRENENIFKNVISAAKRILLISPFTEFVAVLGASGLLYFGTRRVLEGTMSSGFLFLFFVALFSIISPLKGLGSAYANLKHESSALARLFAVLDRKNLISDSGREVFTGIKKKIEFRNVSFAYGNKSVLRDVSFNLGRGEKLGIVGPTGVGKSTLIGLILRFYQPCSGEILADGVNLESFTLQSLRDHIGLVTQEPILFNDTIKSNIAFSGNPDMEMVKKAAENACVKNFIESLPEGYETVVGERGTTLSGGQKQLLSIARAIYKDPSILILDEATASLDSNSEKLLQQALEKIMAGRTVFIIAHRLSTLRNVDRIIVLKEGRITEEGTHKELFARKGDYQRLWELQFSS